MSRPVLPFGRNRPPRSPWPAVAILLFFAVVYEIYAYQTRKADTPGYGSIGRLAVPRKSPDALGRAGDLVLTGVDTTALTIAAAPNITGHRPLLGAIVDVALGPGDVTDPLMWLRVVQLDDEGSTVEPAFRSTQPFRCRDGAAGARAYGSFAEKPIHEICAGEKGRFTLETTSSDEFRPADEFNMGTRPMVVDRLGARWDLEADTGFIASAHGGVAVMIEAPAMHVSRTFSHFGAETFPSPVLVRYRAGNAVRRTLHVVRGDVLHAVARLPSATRAFQVTFGEGRGGDVAILDAEGGELAVGHVERGETRELKLPPDFGAFLSLVDDQGVVVGARVPMPASGAVVRAPSAPAGKVVLAYRDEAGAALPVHVLVKGRDGTPDPILRVATGRTVIAGRSFYLLDGATEAALQPGKYRFTASHGTTYSLAEDDVEVDPGKPVSVSRGLRRVVDTTGWVGADFHLHSAPSPDSDVSLEERVQSLACEGVDLAVATDHNRISDFAPSVRKLGLGDRLATAPGVELTSMGSRWGHFNAYPLPVPQGSPEEGAPVYYQKLPIDMFASARDLGARVLQVNHARMDPGIGYFDLAHLDPRTGRASGEFSSNFDVFEAYNGMWIERREKIREGPIDLVALARRGKRVAAVGDSDSHKLLYEEAGYPRTFVHTPLEPIGTRFTRTVDVLLGVPDTTITSGPFVELSVDGKPVGSVVRPGATGTVHVEVRVSAPAWVPVEHVEIWRDDAVVERFAVEGPAKDGVRFERELDVALGPGKDATLLAWADADAPLPDVVPYEHPLSIGFTGLVYVDGNGDGNVVVPPAP